MGLASTPALTKLLIEGVGLVDVAVSYWSAITQPWFEWLCVIAGFALIYWAALAVASENRELLEANERERADVVARLEERLRDATKLPNLMALRQDAEERRRKIQGWLHSLSHDLQPLETALRELKENQDKPVVVHDAEGPLERLLSQAHRRLDLTPGLNQTHTSERPEQPAIPAPIVMVQSQFLPSDNAEYLARVERYIGRVKAWKFRHEEQLRNDEELLRELDVAIRTEAGRLAGSQSITIA